MWNTSTIHPSEVWLSTVHLPPSTAWCSPSWNVSALNQVHSDGAPIYGVEVDSFQLLSSRLGHGQQDVCYTGWLGLWIVLWQYLPMVPIADISLQHTCWEQNPLAPTSIGNNQVFPALFHELGVLSSLPHRIPHFCNPMGLSARSQWASCLCATTLWCRVSDLCGQYLNKQASSLGPRVCSNIEFSLFHPVARSWCDLFVGFSYAVSSSILPVSQNLP